MLDSSGLKKLEGRSNISRRCEQYSVRFYAELPVSRVNPNVEMVGFSVIITDVIRASILTEPPGGVLWGVHEAPATPASAVELATRMVAHVKNSR